MAFSIPAYVLIDREGRIAKPRVEVDVELVIDIERLLGE